MPKVCFSGYSSLGKTIHPGIKYRTFGSGTPPLNDNSGHHIVAADTLYNNGLKSHKVPYMDDLSIVGQGCDSRHLWRPKRVQGSPLMGLAGQGGLGQVTWQRPSAFVCPGIGRLVIIAWL